MAKFKGKAIFFFLKDTLIIIDIRNLSLTSHALFHEKV